MRYRDLETGVWLTRDPAGFVDGPNLYAYVRQNPWSAFDPHGLWIEDIAIGLPSIGMGAYSFHQNIQAGNGWGAAVDAVGIIADVGTLALPGVPGGAGVAIKAARGTVVAAQKANRVIEAAQQVEAVADTAKAVADAASGEGSWSEAGVGVAEMAVERLAGGRRAQKLEMAENRVLTDEAHAALTGGKFNTSTAVGTTRNGEKVIASSRSTVPDEQIAWAEANGVRVVNGKGHAEETLIQQESMRSLEVSTPYQRQVGKPHNMPKGVARNPNGAICRDRCTPLVESAKVRTTSPKQEGRKWWR